MSQNKRGSTQKKKKFEELSGRQRNRRVEDLSSCDVSQLLLVAVNSARNSEEKNVQFRLIAIRMTTKKQFAVRGIFCTEFLHRISTSSLTFDGQHRNLLFHYVQVFSACASSLIWKSHCF